MLMKLITANVGDMIIHAQKSNSIPNGYQVVHPKNDFTTFFGLESQKSCL